MKAVAGMGRLDVELHGTALSTADAAKLDGVIVRQRLSLPAQVELLFQGADADLVNRASLLVGLSAQIKGDPDDTLLFRGDITAAEVEYSSDAGVGVRLRGYDPLHRLRKRQSVRSFADLNVADLARQLADPIGLSVDARDDGPRRAQLVQWRQSDLALLGEVAAGAGLHFAAAGDTLDLFTLSGGSDTVPLSLGEDLMEVGFEINGDDAVESVAALGWDPTTGKRFEETARDARSGRSSGAKVNLGDLGGDGTRTLANLVARESDPVLAAAQGGLDRAAARQVVVRGVSTGNAAIRPGARLKIDNVAPAFAGEYVVTEATHSMDTERGYITAFSSEPPAPASAPAAATIAPGIVERVDDPEGCGRVAVSLPTFPTIESEWLRVLLPAVGNDAGFIALPNPGDEVLILFPSGDPGLGVVLGGLYSGDHPPDFGVVDGEVKRYTWRTRDGHQIELDESNEYIRALIPNGSAIVMGKDKMSITAATDLDIEAPGKKIRIRASAVDFEKAES